MCKIRSTTRLAYPPSLSYHATSFQNLLLSMIIADTSKTQEASSWRNYVYTTVSSEYLIKTLLLSSAATFMVDLISPYLVSVASRTVKLTTYTSVVGTRNAMPLNFLFNSGMTFPAAFVTPVDDGIMLAPAPRPPRKSFCEC